MEAGRRPVENERKSRQRLYAGRGFSVIGDGFCPSRTRRFADGTRRRTGRARPNQSHRKAIQHQRRQGVRRRRRTPRAIIGGLGDTRRPTGRQGGG